MIKEDNKKMKKYIILIVVILMIFGLGILLLNKSDKDDELVENNKTTTNTSISNSSYASADLFVNNSFDYDRFSLSSTDLPVGYTLDEDEGQVKMLEGCLESSSYCRFKQVLIYPDNTLIHGSFRSGNYKMTMQAVVTSDQSILDNYLVDLYDGESENSLHAINGEYDLYSVLYPSAYVRTENAVFFLVSDRMIDAPSCNGSDDCEELAIVGRSFNSDENSILLSYKTLFIKYTGQSVSEWEWSFGGIQ